MAPLLHTNKPGGAMPTVPAVNLTHLDLRAVRQTLRSSNVKPLIGDHGWACERLGVPDACQIARRAPVVDYDATELVGLRHHHICWLLTLIADPTISHYEPMPVPVSDPQAAEILASFVDRLAPPRPTAQAWVVYEAGRRVGSCQLRRSGEGHLVGVSLQPDVRERGLGTALFKTLGDWGLRSGEFVAGEVEDDNVISHRAIVSAGYLQGDRYPIALADSRPAMVTRYQVDG
jgi:GNAT superfamily N-acetyltransferase